MPIIAHTPWNCNSARQNYLCKMYLSEEYKQELLLLSKRIRMDIWNDKNAKQLYAVMHAISLVFITLFEITGYTG